MKILFASLFSLIDPASGAAISVRTILRMLAERGHEVQALSAGCFDKGQFAAQEEMLRWSGFRPDAVRGTWSYRDGGVQHRVLPLGSHRVTEVAGPKGLALVPELKATLEDFRPDVILSYGYADFEKALRAVAREAGLPLVLYLAHPGYRNPEAFDDAALVFTDSHATQELYRERMALDTTVIGKFIEPPKARPAEGRARHITFVNPAYNKGVTLFYRIAEMMFQVLPSARFLVVESRASLAEAERRSGLAFSQMRNLRVIGLQTDMGEVFSRTSVLLMPSLWHESGGRTAIEALSLGIPVVSSDHGGMAEHLGDGAIKFTVPEQLRANPRLIPPPSVAVPWVSTLAELWTDRAYWQEASDRARARWRHHDPAERLALVERKLAQLAG